MRSLAFIPAAFTELSVYLLEHRKGKLGMRPESLLRRQRFWFIGLPDSRSDWDLSIPPGMGLTRTRDTS